MKRDYWIFLFLAGFLLMLPLGPLLFLLLLFVPGFALLVLLKERFDIVELFAYSATLSILIFPLVVLIAWLCGVWHAGAFLLGLLVMAVAAYKYYKRAGLELVKSRLQWPVIGIALFIFIVVFIITLKTFTLTDAGLVVSTTHASDLNFHLSIIQRYITSPSLPPEDPYLPGYSIVYNWFMHLLMGELGVLTGVDLFVILKVLIPLVCALIFADVYLLALLLFKSERDALVSSIIYVAASGLSWAYIAYQVLIQGNAAPDVFKLMVYEWPGIMTLKYDPTVLFFFLPQTQTFGLLAMIFGFYTYLQAIKTRSLAYAAVTGAVLASLVLFHMITAFPVFIAMGIMFLYLAAKKRFDSALAAAIPMAIAAIASLYQLSILQQGNASQVILGHNPDVPLTILFSIGLLIPFAIYGMYLKWKDESCALLILFAIINFVFLNVLELPATVNTYRFLVYMALPVSLFAGLVFSRWLSKGKAWMKVVSILVIILMVPSTAIMVGFYNDSSYTHATTAEYNGLVWIKDNTPKNAVIFEEPGFFPRAPVVTGRDVAYSGEIYTTQYHNVDLQADTYSIMDITDPSSLYDRLSQYHVNYVFLGQRESAHAFVSALSDTDYFKPVYDKDGVKVYELQGTAPLTEVKNMDISTLDWLAFFAAILYLLIVPGFNVMRTLGWDKKLVMVEKIAFAFGISVCILVIVATLLAMPFSIGLNFYTIVIIETIIIVLTTREVVDRLRRTVKI